MASPEDIPENSELEEQAVSSFGEGKVTTEEEFTNKVEEVFDEILGDTGHEVFFGSILPEISAIYGSNYRKAGLKVLEIINQASDHLVGQVNSFLEELARTLASEVKLADIDQEIKYNETVATIKALITERSGRFGRKGVVGVIVYGSYARKSINSNSDLDIIPVVGTEEQKAGEDDPETGEYVNYLEDFLARLEHSIHIDSPHGSVWLENTQELARLRDSDLLRDGATFVTPFPELQDVLKDSTPSQ